MEKLTICIPTLNNAKTISLTLEQLNIQGYNLKIKVFDNGSADGTKELVQAISRNNFYPFLKIDFVEIQGMAQGRVQNIPYQRYKISQEVQTELLMFLDSDVILTPTAIKNLVEEFEKRPDLGMLGVRYEPLADHVQMGAVLMKTEIAKSINWKIDEKCECANAISDLAQRGLKAEYHPWLQARHIKFI